MKKIVIILIMTCVTFLNCRAQQSSNTRVETYFPYSSAVYSPKFHREARLYSVVLNGFMTEVTIELTPTKNMKRMNFWTSSETYVQSGYAQLPLWGALRNNQIHGCSYNDHWGWSNVKKGQKYYYTLVFIGRFPEGMTSFSLIDPVQYGRGYSFSGYTINNPKIHEVADESYCKRIADEYNDGFCGIYEEMGGNGYKLGVVRNEGGNYFIVYLGCNSTTLTYWFPGDLKAVLEESAKFGVFKAQWVMRNKTISNNSYITFDGTIMKTYLPDGAPEESTYVRMYPK